MILSADTASEKCKLLSKKHREYFVYSRAFLQRRLCFAAAGAVLKPAGRESCGVAFTGGILLNSENLNTILAQYIHDFAELSLSQTSGEGSLWQAIDTFGAEWDIEASDFPAMFARAMQGAADQLDTPAVQPVAGLKLLMMRDSEVELVRECFRWLYNDEDDDLKKRRGRAEMFADQITGRFRRCFPRMNKYTMTPVHAVYFLNLWMPEENFFYIPAEAKAWADFMEYPAEFGNGASLDLAAYYAMCEDLVTALADYPDLIAQHKERLRTQLGGINDQLHLLAYDILHAAYQRGYYPKGFSRNATAKERAKAVKEKQTRAELCLQIAEKEQELQIEDDKEATTTSEAAEDTPDGT